MILLYIFHISKFFSNRSTANIIQVLLPICCRRQAQVLLDKLAEEGQVGKIEFGADFLNRLVGVAQLLADSAHGGLVYQVKG